jgi:hypothetical protein
MGTEEDRVRRFTAQLVPPTGDCERKVDMSEHPEPEQTEEANEEATENKPLGFFQYPAPPGQTEYGTYQNPHRE